MSSVNKLTVYWFQIISYITDKLRWKISGPLLKPLTQKISFVLSVDWKHQLIKCQN